MYERRHEPLLSRRAFLRRLALYVSFAIAILIGSLLVGILGYHLLVGLGWTDSLLNASMILGGMGPVNEIKTDSGKVFASLYALYSGFVVLAVAGLIFAPIFHRFLHHFHIDIEEGDETDQGEQGPSGSST
jgi:hypothetical protein